jgi:hypothetical protein
MAKTIDQELSEEELKEFEDVMVENTAICVHDTFPNLRKGVNKIPFIAREDVEKDINFLKKVCVSYKELFSASLIYEFEKGMCYFKLEK